MLRPQVGLYTVSQKKTTKQIFDVASCSCYICIDWTPCLIPGPPATNVLLRWNRITTIAVYECPPGHVFKEGGRTRTLGCSDGHWPDLKPFCHGKYTVQLYTEADQWRGHGWGSVAHSCTSRQRFLRFAETLSLGVDGLGGMRLSAADCVCIGLAYLASGAIPKTLRQTLPLEPAGGLPPPDR